MQNLVSVNLLKSLMLIGVLVGITYSTYAQNVGINEQNPSNTLHVKPFSIGDEPLRVEGVQPQLLGDTALFIHNPNSGVVRYITLTNLTDTLINNFTNNDAFLDSIVSIIYNYGDTLLYNSTFITNLQDSIDTHLDSLSFVNNILTGWVDGNPYTVDLSSLDVEDTHLDSLTLDNNILTGWVNGTPNTVDLTSLETITLDSLVDIIYNYGDTLLHNNTFISNLQDSIDTHLDSLTFDNNILTGWVDGTPYDVDLSGLDVEDTFLDSLVLTGTTLTGWVDGNANDVDLSSLVGTDSQTLSLAGDNLSISNGNTVSLSFLRDHDWYEASTTNQPGDINDDIYTQGNVGIGTNNPVQRLHLSGTGLRLRMENTDAAGNTYDFLSGNAGNFRINNVTQGTNPISILGSNSFVGINEDNPQAQLHLSGTALNLRLQNTSATGSIFSLNSTNGGDLRILNLTAAPTFPLTILGSNDFVGIGTTAPNVELEVNGSVMINNGSVDGARLIWRGGTGGTLEYRARVLGTGNLGFFPIESGNPGYIDEVLTLTQTGLVGIGEPNPLTKLHMHNGSFHISNSNEPSSVFLTQDGGLELYRHPTVTISPNTNGYVDFKDNAADDYDVRIYYNHDLGAGGDGFVIETTTDGQPGTALQRLVVLNQTGRVGIGTNVPDQLLSVNGDASKIGGGAWLAFSDARLKEDVKSFSDGLEVILKLNPVSFKYNDKSGYDHRDKEFVGFIAQEVEEVAPYMIEKTDDSNGVSGLEDRRTLDESALTKILVNAIQEQQAMIEALKQENKLLKEEKLKQAEINQQTDSKLQDMEAQLSTLIKLVNSLNEANK
jgi:hypothetical protein